MSFLPALMEFDGNWANWAPVEDRLHKQFSKDFIERICIFKGKRVEIDFRLDANKEVSFWHLTTRDYFKTSNRYPEGDRALRIHWIRQVIENYKHTDVSYFCYPEPRNIRHYFWVKCENYLVILEERKTSFRLVTAYVVDKKYMREDLQRKLDACHQCPDVEPT